MLCYQACIFIEEPISQQIITEINIQYTRL